MSDHHQSVACDLGCKCQRSRCLKKYCICFERQTTCSISCKCIGCLNNDQAAAKEHLDKSSEKDFSIPNNPAVSKESEEDFQVGKIDLSDPNDSLICLPKFAEFRMSQMQVSPQSKGQHQALTAPSKDSVTKMKPIQGCMWLNDKILIPERASLMIFRFLDDSDIMRYLIANSSHFRATKMSLQN